ncbi:MAG: alpha/beta hydrolase [Patescibacteria group bacterium]
MNNKPQIFFVHGAESFRTYTDYLSYLKNREVSLGKWVNWRDAYLDKHLGRDFEISRPRMPNPDNAQYSEWKINFENYIKLLRDGVILIGVSMGGIFLTKYLSENKFPKKISALIVVATPYDGSLAGEYFGGGFKLKSDISLIEKNCKNVNLFFSSNDEVVPLIHAEKYKSKLKQAKIFILDDKNGHFRVETFPEIVKLVKSL